jgi:RHS repeat-associated protein
VSTTHSASFSSRSGDPSGRWLAVPHCLLAFIVAFFAPFSAQANLSNRSDFSGWAGLPVNTTTGAFSGWWNVPLAENSGDAVLVNLTVRGTLPGGGVGGAPSAADSNLTLLVPAVSESPQYDQAGRIEKDALWTYSWDSLGRLLQMDRRPGTLTIPGADGERLNFGYDADGRRTQRRHTVTYTSGATKIEFSNALYSGNLPVMQEQYVDGLLTRRRWFQWGADISGTLEDAAGIGGLVAIYEEGGRTLLPVDDGLGNITAVIDAATQQSVARYDYGPFGESLSVIGDADACPFRWQTRWYDRESDLYCFPHRYYNPRLGRWLSRDPIGEAGGFNLYAYCGNDPVNRHDPLGLSDEIGIWEFDPITGQIGWVSDYNRYYFGKTATLNGQAGGSAWNRPVIDQPLRSLGGRSMTMVFGTQGARALYGGAELFADATVGITPFGAYMASRSATEGWMDFAGMEAGEERAFTGTKAALDTVGALLYVVAPLATGETSLFKRGSSNRNFMLLGNGQQSWTATDGAVFIDQGAYIRYMRQLHGEAANPSTPLLLDDANSVDNSWKFKIHGGAQKTGTPGHQFRTYREAIAEAKNPDVIAVYLDYGYNRALGLDPKTISPNRRPDVLSIYNDGTVKRIEVQSITDVPAILRSRNSALDQQLINQGFIPTPPVIVVPH